MLKENVLKTIKKFNLINKGDKIVIGVSGGPDSICLLHILNELKNDLNIDIFVAHINHMLRKNADKETEYVQNICKKMQIECFIKKVDILKLAREQKKGTEEVRKRNKVFFF